MRKASQIRFNFCKNAVTVKQQPHNKLRTSQLAWFHIVTHPVQRANYGNAQMLKSEINCKKICTSQRNTLPLTQFFRFRSFLYEITHEVGSILHQPLFVFAEASRHCQANIFIIFLHTFLCTIYASIFLFVRMIFINFASR